MLTGVDSYARSSSERPTSADGVRIEYATAGAGPDLVLVHGLTDSSQTWGPLTPRLAERYRVTRLDLRGMGASGDAADYSSIAMVRFFMSVSRSGKAWRSNRFCRADCRTSFQVAAAC